MIFYISREGYVPAGAMHLLKKKTMLVDKRILCAALSALERDLAVKYGDAQGQEVEAAMEFARQTANLRISLEHGGYADQLICKSATVLLPGENK